MILEDTIGRNLTNLASAGADPELLLGGDANPWGGGERPPNILVIFSEKPNEIKEILAHRGSARRMRPLNPPLQCKEVFLQNSD